MADDDTGEDGSGTAGDGDDRQRAARDADRLAALEARLAQLRGDNRPSTPGMDKFQHANQAWRMVVELVAGLAIGFGFGLGLDWLLGTAPLMLVIFVFLGFAAGVKTMLRTAAEMGGTVMDKTLVRPADEQAPAPPAGVQTPAPPATDKMPAGPATDKMPAGPATDKMPAGPATDKMPAGPATDKMPAGPATDKMPAGPAGTKGTERGD